MVHDIIEIKVVLKKLKIQKLDLKIKLIAHKHSRPDMALKERRLYQYMVKGGEIGCRTKGKEFQMQE